MVLINHHQVQDKLKEQQLVLFPNLVALLGKIARKIIIRLFKIFSVELRSGPSIFVTENFAGRSIGILKRPVCCKQGPKNLVLRIQRPLAAIISYQKTRLRKRNHNRPGTLLPER